MTEFEARLQSSLGTQYRLERELGGGGMSRVFLAEESALGRKVVIKLLPPELAALADHRVRIPIHGRAESLNLSTAAALCLYASAKAQRADRRA